MSDPKRWLESGGNATPLERELLAGEIAAAPGARLENAVWQRVLGALPPIGGGSPDTGGNGAGGDWGASAAGGTSATGAGSGGASAIGAGAGGTSVVGAGASVAGPAAGSALVGAAKASGLGVAKALVLGVFTGTVAVTGAAEISERVTSAPAPRIEVRRESSAEPAVEPPTPRLRSATAIAAPPAAAPVPAWRAPARSGEAALPPVVTGSASARFELPATDLESRTRAERLALEQARRALRNGDPATALGVVDRAAQSGSVLVQEREVLAIEALSAAGRGSDAKARASAFLSRFPGSPHQNHVRQFAR